MAWQKSSHEGCCHCLSCLPVALTYALCDATRRSQPEPYQPWWPASIDSPALYYRLKRRALAHQFREQARAGFSDPATWRAAAASAAAGRGNALLGRRGQRQLGLRVPTARTNVTAGDELEFVGVFSMQPAAQAALAPQPPQQPQQPLQGSPMAVQYLAPQQTAAPQQPHQQQQQQQQQPAVLRPQARRLVPRPPAPSLPECHPAAAQAHAASLSLLASLSYQEQCHRQQLAAQQPAWPSSSYAAAEAHPAALLRHSSSWDLQALQAQAQQAQYQQAAASLAAAAEAAAWPFAVPTQQQGGWAYAGSQAPLACQPPVLPLFQGAALAAC